MATERFQARIAPAGLALVQDLVNTHAVERDGADLLASHASAQQWLREATGQWARDRGLEPPAMSLPKSEVQALRDFREAVQDMLALSPDARPGRPCNKPADLTPRAQVTLVADDTGWMAMMPTGTGVRWLESAVWSEILLAQQNNEWSRVKLCREPGCRSAFYDTSRNGSGAWHNVRTCGNIANLRASRNRKKKAEDE